MTITVHIGSLVVGFLAGAASVFCIFVMAFYDDRWNNGFAHGFEAGEKYALKDKEKK